MSSGNSLYSSSLLAGGLGLTSFLAFEVVVFYITFGEGFSFALSVTFGFGISFEITGAGGGGGVTIGYYFGGSYSGY